MNNRIKDALKVIEIEYCKLEKSTDRYVLFMQIEKEMDIMRDKMNKRVQDGVDLHLSNIEDQVLSIISEMCSCEIEKIKEVKNKPLKDVYELCMFDELDWIETIMMIENDMNVEIPISYEDNETTIQQVILFVNSLKV